MASCQDDSTVILGKYEGYWFDTSWEYQFFRDHTFKFVCVGHYNNTESLGTYERRGDSLFLTPNLKSLVNSGVVNELYLIDGDSCIIDFRLKYDYCNHRDYSKSRDIKYPQIETEEPSRISSLQSMLQEIFDSQEFVDQVYFTEKSLVIQNYYKLAQDLSELRFSNKPVLFKTENEIQEQGITNYIVIENINFNKSSCSFNIKIIPHGYGSIIHANYYLIDNKWLRK